MTDFLMVVFIKLFLFFWGICVSLDQDAAEEIIIQMGADIKTQRQQDHYNDVVLNKNSPL